MVVGANLQLKDKLEAPQVGTSGPSQQRHYRRYYQNPTALHCLSSAHSDNDTTLVHWVKWKVLRQCQCKLHTRQVVQAMLQCAMLSCAEEECAQWSPCLDHIFLIETSINLTNVKAWFSTKLSPGEYLQILQNQYESKHSSVYGWKYVGPVKKPGRLRLIYIQFLCSISNNFDWESDE